MPRFWRFRSKRWAKSWILREFPIYTRLSQDPRALLEYCKARGFIPKGSYYNRCHLCQDMRLFLYCREPGVYKDLRPRRLRSHSAGNRAEGRGINRFSINFFPISESIGR